MTCLTQDAIDLVLCRLTPESLAACACCSSLWRGACQHAITSRRRDYSIGCEAVPVTVAVAGRCCFPAAEYISECVGGTPATVDRLHRATTRGCSCHGESLVYDEQGLLRSLLLPESESEDVPIVECSDRCRCADSCPNRVVSRGIRVALTIFMTRDGRGWGLRADEPLRRGQFVCEYAGEIISSSEAAARRRAYAGERDGNYIMSVVEHVGS